jgi:carboxylesterase type B
MNEQNLGIRDLRLALEWVHQNIGSFGGDPEKITFGGQSSGADAISVLAYAYPDDPIARAYLFESRNPQLAISQGDPTAEFHRIASTVGCRNKADSMKELDCMRTVPAADLRAAISDNTWNNFGVPFGGNPFSDNHIVFTAADS